ncbi:hypothetical protein RHGRI_006438 [Rhododendron griersonianum]|uniref:CP-type G domain-containing protein n=1 Tax=Rhododendron griersonianum TaxID=479676 RepID=A0AAV6KU59_9ERIC|nr:hypothetical protein RHGRI_006438 [Rhododendron griersonianum]
MAATLSSAILPSATSNPTMKLSVNGIFRGKKSYSLPLFTGQLNFHMGFPSYALMDCPTGLGEKNKGNYHKKGSFVCLAVKGSESTIQTTHKNSRKSQRKSDEKLILSEGRDEDEKYGTICPGCGVFMQDKDPNLPGYFQERKAEAKQLLEDEEVGFEEFDKEKEDEEEVGFEVFDEEEEYEEGVGFEEFDEEEDDEEVGFEDFDEEEEKEGILDEIDGNYDKRLEEEGNLKNKKGIDWDMEEWESAFFKDEDDDSDDLDGFLPAGVGYGNVTEESISKGKKKRVSKAERKELAREAQREKEEVTVCARCHSLRNYGQVKNQTAENLIPDFDFDRLITTRLMKPGGNADATVVVMVVDCVDFDGSFPKRAAKSLFKALEGSIDGVKISKKMPKLVLVATKVDLLPSQISPARLDRWVRHRAKAGGARKLNGVYLVSSRKDTGVRNVLAFIKELTGPRGNVWVIGAQNAGKSTLINALAKKQGVKVTKLTEAPVPGTTLGILRIGGILPAKAKMYDTPGLLHPYLMSMRLNREEQKMVELRKELKPRTYRIKASCFVFQLNVGTFMNLLQFYSQGQAVHVGALMRLDLNHASVDTIYVTVWASPNVSLHMGKIENADEILSKHAGIRLQPPIDVERVSELGKWEGREIKVSGTSWDVNSIDISAAGLGWFSLGLKGNATLTLWIYDGIEVSLRDPLVLDRARFIERPGFWLPKAISEALGNQSKMEAQKKNELQETMSL